MKAALRFGAMASLLFASGCDAVCNGSRPPVRCADLWSANRLVVHEQPVSGSRQLWLDADEWMLDDGAGKNWSIAIGTNAVYVGHPDVGQVVRWNATGSRIVGRGRPGFGESLAVTDMDGDGSIDLWVGMPSAASSRGVAYLFLDIDTRACSDESDVDCATPESANNTSEGADPGNRLGESIVLCGDLDGDGFNDVAMPMPSTPAGQSRASGAVRIHRTSTFTANADIDSIATTLTPALASGRLGQAVACEQDIDGDGVADLAIGAPNLDLVDEPFTRLDEPEPDASTQPSPDDVDDTGRVYIVSGTALASGTQIIDDISTRTILPAHAGGFFGFAIATGDLTGDGLADLAIGSPAHREGDGRVDVVAADTPANEDGSVNPLTSIFANSFEPNLSRAGQRIAFADLDDDGIPDLILGMPDFTSATAVQHGMVSIWSGSGAADWSSTLLVNSDEDATVEGDSHFSHAGNRLATGDVTGDGKIDLLLTSDVRPAR